MLDLIEFLQLFLIFSFRLSLITADDIPYALSICVSVKPGQRNHSERLISFPAIYIDKIICLSDIYLFTFINEKSFYGPSKKEFQICI